MPDGASTRDATNGRSPAPAQHRPTSGQVIALAAWFGLVTGTGAVALDALKKFGLHQVTLIPPDVVWISPLTYVLLALISGTVLAAVVRLVRRWVTLREVVFVLAAAGCAGGLLTWGKALQDISVILLSLGIAVQFSALAQRRPVLFGAIVRRSTPWLLGVVAASTLIVHVGARLRERRAVAALPAADAGAPNVIWIILDTMRSLDTGLGLETRPTTPSLARFARSAITFDRAISPSSWTLVSHAAMFTGRPAHDLSADWDVPLDDRYPTLAEYLRAHGYRTGGIAGNWYYCNSEWGLARGFTHYQDFTLSLGHAFLATFPGERLVNAIKRSRLADEFWSHVVTGRRIAPDVRRSLMSWLRQDRTRPFFAFVNFYDAHDHYVAPDGYLDRIDSGSTPFRAPVMRREKGRLVPATDARRQDAIVSRKQYEAAIAWLDDQVGQLLDQLDREGFLRNTMVVIVADHGEEFGAHAEYWHGKSLYLPSISVPLLVRLPDGSHAGEHVRLPVSTRRLAATTVDVLGLARSAPFPGPSLSGLWSGVPGRDETAYAFVRTDERDKSSPAAAFRSIVDSTSQYIVDDRGHEELFDYLRDRWEQVNLAPRDSARLAHYRALVSERDPSLRANAGPASGRN